MKKLLPARQEKEGTGFWQSGLNNILFFFILLLLPTQLGRHFWPTFSFVLGQRVDYLSPTVYITDILILFLVILNLFQSLISRRFRHQSNLLSVICSRSSVSLLLVLLFLSVGIFLSLNPLAGWYGILKFLEFVFFGWYVVMRSKTQIKMIPIALGIGILIESGLTMLQYFHQASLGGLFYFFGERAFSGTTPGIANASLNGQLVLRPYGTFSHPNVLAGFLVLGMIFVVFFRRRTTEYGKQIAEKQIDRSSFRFLSHLLSVFSHQYSVFWKGFVLLIGSIGLLFTLSRVAILLWLLIVLSIIATRKKTWIFGTMVLLAGLIIVSPLLVSRFSFSLTDESLTQRLFLIKAAFSMITSHPLFGVGLHNFLPALPYYTDAASQAFILQPVHNIFLLIASETGLMGFLGVVLFLFLLIKRINSLEKLLLLGIVVVIGIFDHYFLTLQQGQLLLALVIGYCWRNSPQ